MSPSYSEQSDYELLKGIVARDALAFESLYDRYKSRLYQYLKLLVKEHVTAEDLLAETMIKVWQKASTFKNTSEVSTWLFSVARHQALDFQRGEQRNTLKNKRYEHSALSSEAPENPEHQTDQNIMKAAIANGMSELSPEQQMVLFLTYYQGMAYQEIATVLDIPVNTVKTRVHSAKQKLRKILEPKQLHDEL